MAAGVGQIGRMRRILRWLALGISSLLVLPIIGGVAGEFFIELARERGWYDHPSQRLDAAVSTFSAFVTQPWFLVVTALFVGLALGAWLDLLLRRQADRTSSQTTADPISRGKSSPSIPHKMTLEDEAALIERLRRHAGSRAAISFVFEKDKLLAQRLIAIFNLAGWEGVRSIQSAESILRNVERIDVSGQNQHLVSFVQDALAKHGLVARPKIVDPLVTKDDALRERLERTVAIMIHHP
jgi:hypothetical protein